MKVLSIFIVVILNVLADLQINPEELRLYANTTGSVTVSCSIPDNISYTSVSVRISRTRPSPHSGSQPLVVANESGPNSGQAVLVPPSEGGLAANTATVTGSTADKSVNLTLTQADCQDDGLYCCNILYSSGTASHELNNCRNLTTTVLLGNITISVSPTSGPYTVGSIATLTCKAVIGNEESGQKWSWYYRSEGTIWQQYTEEKDIINDAPVPLAGSCRYYRQTSSLKRTISLDDEGRFYKCKVERNNDSTMPETISIENVEDAVTSTVANTTTAENQTGFSDRVSSADCLTNMLLYIYLIISVSLAVLIHNGF